MHEKPIGILAGMGPRSTAPFIDLVVDECQRLYGAKYDIDFPQIVILSQPTPFFLDRPNDHAAMRRSILEGLKNPPMNVEFISKAFAPLGVSSYFRKHGSQESLTSLKV